MRKRNCRVEIYFTKDELESLTKKVRKSGLSRESFCRHLLNGAEIKEAPSADVPMLINEVRRVGYNIDQMPANIELSGTEVGLFNVMSREYVLKSYIDSVSKNYDYILIDCMPSLGMMTINALAAADRVIIPSQPSFLSTKCTARASQSSPPIRQPTACRRSRL